MTKELKDTKEKIKLMAEDYHNVREVGCELALAAIRVIKDYDGIHRLSLAVSKWFQVIADEGKKK